MESEDTLGELISDFFQKYNSESFQYSTVQKVLTMDFETRKQAMQVICGRMQFDGEMASSGAATDPLFWVGHVPICVHSLVRSLQYAIRHIYGLSVSVSPFILFWSDCRVICDDIVMCMLA